MQSIIQTNFTGIDALEYQEKPMPELTDNGVLVKMLAFPITPTLWKMATNPNATAESFSALPRVIGVFGVGEIIAVGKNRDQALLGKKAQVLDPSGIFSEYVLSENPDWLLLLPDKLEATRAATLLGGADTAEVLEQEIKASKADQILVTGANSVIGLFLFQLLARTNKQILPIVSPASKNFFTEQVPDFKAYTTDELPEQLTGSSLILDIAGSESLIQTILTHCPNAEVASIALMQSENIRFINEEFDTNKARDFLQMLAEGKLKAPIGKIFTFSQVKEAMHFAKESHSRGRVIVSCEDK